MARPTRSVTFAALALALVVLTPAVTSADTTSPVVNNQDQLPAAPLAGPPVLDDAATEAGVANDRGARIGNATELEAGREYLRNPLRVRVGDESKARLADSIGNAIPFAADDDTNDGVVHLPSLVAGDYVLSGSGEPIPFTVTYEQNFLEKPASLDDLARGASTPKLPLYGLIAASAMLAAVVLRRRRAFLLAVIVAAAAGGVGVSALPSGSVPADVSTCLNLDDDVVRNQCLLDRVLYLTSTNDGDPTDARQELRAAANVRGCHEVAHTFGKLSYLLGGYDAVAQRGPHNCDGGFYHGALEAASIYLDDEAFIAKARAYCSEVLPGGSSEFTNCAHGLGHGGMFRFAGDLDKVVEFCRSLDMDTVDIESCSGAAYMEHARMHATAAGDGAFTPRPDVNTRELCPSLPIELAVHCYDGVAMGTPITETSADELLEFCNREPGPGANRLACVSGVMQEVVNHARNVENSAARCQILDGVAERAVCVAKIAQRFGLNLPDGSVEKICIGSGVSNVEFCRVDPSRYYEHLRSDKPAGTPPALDVVDPFAPTN